MQTTERRIQEDAVCPFMRPVVLSRFYRIIPYLDGNIQEGFLLHFDDLIKKCAAGQLVRV